MKNSSNSGNRQHFLPIYMCIGLSLGMVIGAAMDNIPIGMCIGLGVGVCLGSVLDARQKKESDNSPQADATAEEQTTSPD